MNLYIFLTSSTVKMGGAEVYLRNKSEYLTNVGWDVLIFSYIEGNNTYIKELQKYQNLIIPSLMASPFYITKRGRNKVIKRIISHIKISKYSSIVIESSTLGLGEWGELVAKRISAKHIIYLLAEQESMPNKRYLDFLKFKLQQNELFGIARVSIKKLFQPFMDIELEDSPFLLAKCSTCVENVHSTINIPDADYNIGSLGRIDKPYLNEVIRDVEKFASQYRKNRINYFLIGGELRGKKNKTKFIKFFKKIENVNLIITDFIFPIPLEFLRKFDVFLSSAGSAKATASLGLPTISYDGNDYRPIGIVFKTTKNCLFRDKEPAVDGKSLIEDILIRKKYEFAPIAIEVTGLDYSDHLSQLIYNHNEYFSFDESEKNKSEIIHSITCHIFGAHLGIKLSKSMLRLYWRISKNHK